MAKLVLLLRLVTGLTPGRGPFFKKGRTLEQFRFEIVA